MFPSSVFIQFQVIKTKENKKERKGKEKKKNYILKEPLIANSSLQFTT